MTDKQNFSYNPLEHESEQNEQTPFWDIHKFFLLIGIICTIISVFLSHSIVGETNDKIDKIEEDINADSVEIDRLWQRQQELEMRSATSYLLGLVSSNNITHGYIDDTLRYFVISDEDKNNLTKMELVKKYTEIKKREIMDKIDMIYINTTMQQAKIVKLKKENDKINTISLFFQIVGLIFVLYRHDH